MYNISLYFIIFNINILHYKHNNLSNDLLCVYLLIVINSYNQTYEYVSEIEVVITKTTVECRTLVAII